MTEYFMPIGELSKKLDIPAHTLRYWEREFPTLITPTTGAGGRRFYRQETVGNIFALKKYLYADGRTIDGVKKMVANGEFVKSEVGSRESKVDSPKPVANIRPAENPDIQSAIRLLDDAKRILAE
jgi:DNA-binding transcriptional MerR regulator